MYGVAPNEAGLAPIYRITKVADQKALGSLRCLCKLKLSLQSQL